MPLDDAIDQPNRPAFADASRLVLGLGSLFFGAWALIHPRGLAAAMGDDPRYARPLGIRDGVIGAALLATNSPGPLVARMAADVSDAVRLASRSPRVAAGAAGFALLAAATLAAGTKR